MDLETGVEVLPKQIRWWWAQEGGRNMLYGWEDVANRVGLKSKRVLGKPARAFCVERF
jgi:hypothetical protein